nr:MAG TPA: hypothetical protein [Caudoviricetes sp.]
MQLQQTIRTLELHLRLKALNMVQINTHTQLPI